MNVMQLVKWIRQRFFQVKYYFDVGRDFMSIVSFSLLVITASDKLLPAFTYLFGIEHLSQLIMIMIPLGFVGAICFGAVMLHVVKSQRTYEKEGLMKHSYCWVRTFKEFEELKSEIKLLKASTGDLKKIPQQTEK